MANIWNEEELETLKSVLHLNTKDIYNEYVENFGPARSYDSVQKKVKALKDLYSEENDFKKVALSDNANDELVPLQEFSSTTKEFKEVVANWLSEASKELKGKVIKPKESNKASLILHLSDNHFGKHTSRYNLEIARERTTTMLARVMTSLGNLDNVDEVVVALVGDEVEGEDIYSNQNGSLECPVIYQAKAAAEAYWQLALNIRKTMGPDVAIRFVTAPGNHGRMSKTANTESNWDNVVYLMLSLLAQENEDLNIDVDLNFGEFKEFVVKDKKLLAYHYGTKHLGTPAMQIKMAGWIISKGIEAVLHGHWHHWGVETYLGIPMIHNGSMCGSDDLAEKMAVEEPPRQAFLLVEKDKPISVFGFVEW